MPTRFGWEIAVIYMVAGLSVAIVGGLRVVVPDSLSLLTTYVLLEQRDWFEERSRALGVASAKESPSSTSSLRTIAKAQCGGGIRDRSSRALA